MARATAIAARILAAVIVFSVSSVSGFLFAISLSGKSPVDVRLIFRATADLARGDYDALAHDLAMAYVQFMTSFSSGVKTLLEYTGYKASQFKEKVKRKVEFRYRVNIANAHDVCDRLTRLTHVDEIAGGRLRAYADTRPEPGRRAHVLIKAVGYVERVKTKGETIVIYSTPYYIEAEASGVFDQSGDLIVDPNSIRLKKVERKS